MASIRKFETGATRDQDSTKPDYEGFLSPLVLERYGQYMSKHRVQVDGSLRDSDNWQKGIPKDAYVKSGWRHFMDWWKEHRGIKTSEGLEDALCALLFNVSGYLHETLKAKNSKPQLLVANTIEASYGAPGESSLPVVVDGTPVTGWGGELVRSEVSGKVDGERETVQSGGANLCEQNVEVGDLDKGVPSVQGNSSNPSSDRSWTISFERTVPPIGCECEGCQAARLQERRNM